MIAAPRHATPLDRDQLITTLTEAFVADPFWVHLLEDPKRPGFADVTHLRACMEIETDSHLIHGHTYLVPDLAAAVWNPPGIHASMAEISEAIANRSHPERLTEALPVLFEMLEWRPDAPHFYLHLLGARDGARGQGLGSVLLRRVLDICDTENHVAYLEASSARNAALYERHGFIQLTELAVNSEISLRPMRREPGD